MGPTSRSVPTGRLDVTGRPGGNRTPNPRFWRPVLCQLSYWPTRVPPHHDQRGPRPYLYFDSRCTVCDRQKRQYFLNSSRPVAFLLFFVVL